MEEPSVSVEELIIKALKTNIDISQTAKKIAIIIQDKHKKISEQVLSELENINISQEILEYVNQYKFCEPGDPKDINIGDLESQFKEIYIYKEGGGGELFREVIVWKCDDGYHVFD
jgi:hypothetical protein